MNTKLCYFSQFDQLASVALRGTYVSTPGKQGEISRSIPNVQELDLSSNLLSSWEDVAGICQQLANLTTLNISWVSITKLGFTIICFGKNFYVVMQMYFIMCNCKL